jgi:hypothetical protein
MKSLSYLLILIILNNSDLFAQSDTTALPIGRVYDITKNTFIYPHVWKPGSLKVAVGLSSTKFPLDFVETALRIPLLDASATIGLPKGLDFSMNISSIYIANQMRAGIHWNREGKVFSTKLGFDAGFIFGSLTQYGFDNRTSAWTHYPNFSIGFKVRDVAITLRTEANIVTYINTTAGGIKISEFTDFYNGGSAGLYLEQRLWGKHVMIVGCRDVYVKYYYPVWPAFSEFNRRYHNLEFFLGLILK